MMFVKWFGNYRLWISINDKYLVGRGIFLSLEHMFTEGLGFTFLLRVQL